MDPPTATISTTSMSNEDSLTISTTATTTTSITKEDKLILSHNDEEEDDDEERMLRTPTSSSQVEPCPWEESLEAVHAAKKKKMHQNEPDLLLTPTTTATDDTAETVFENKKQQQHLEATTTTTTVIVVNESTEEEEAEEEEEEHATTTSVVTAKKDANSTATTTTATTASSSSSFLRHYMRCYYELWKTRLSSLVVFTTMGGYYAAGGDVCDWKSSLALMSGTFMQAACANSLNELIEVKRDRVMTRTQNRPLPTGRISKFHALVQAIVMGTGGTWLLYKYNNPLTAGLGVANILIYAGIYTPFKVIHWFNTWIGTLNGSLAPLMGSASVTNDIADPSGLFLFGSMYLWQISHFMAICYKCKFDYNRAGYKMLSISNPEQAATQAVVHSAALFPICWALPYYGILPWWFAVVSTPINYYLLLKPSIQFKKKVNYERATSLFFKTLGHLPALFFTSVFAFCWQRMNWGEKLKNAIARLLSSFSLSYSASE